MKLKINRCTHQWELSYGFVDNAIGFFGAFLYCAKGCGTAMSIEPESEPRMKLGKGNESKQNT